MVLAPSFCKRMLENLNTAVLVVDNAMCISYLNPAAETLLAVSRSRAMTQPLAQFFVEADKEESLKKIEQTLQTAHPFTKREAHLRIHGIYEVIVDYTVTVLLSPNHAPELLIEIQQIDRLLRIAREEAIVSNHQVTKQMVRSVAHEIKNPLGGIRGAAQLLERALPNNHLKEYTQIIIEEADRLRNLADRMLGARKLPDLKAVNIHECLERVRSLILAEAAGKLHISRDYDLSLPELTTDSDQLIQAILNITRNAQQALFENTQQQQAPCIIFKTRAQRQFTIGVVRHRLVLRIDIIDNGPGIPPHLIDTIFYPMVTGRASGTGLGLAIAQDIINTYHGMIECTSQVGQTQFSIFLPVEKNGYDSK